MKTTPRYRAGLVALLALAGCSTAPPKDPNTYNRIKAEMRAATEDRIAKEQQQKSVMQALLPPIAPEIPAASPTSSEPRFDVTVANASVSEVFNAIVTDTRYSVIVHPDVKGTVTLSLKRVTVPEVFRTICDIRQFDCHMEGTRLIVQPAMLQTRMYKIDYLNTERKGSSDVRVSSNAIAPTAGTSTPGTPGAVPVATPGGVPGAPGTSASAPSLTSTRIGTTSTINFWTELRLTLAVLIGCSVAKDDEVLCQGEQKDYRVVVSPQSGTVLVRAMPDQLRQIGEYLRASQNTLERQVLIEAKILEVTLSDGFQSGVNWAGFFSQATQTLGLGLLSPGTRLGTTGSGVLLDSGAPNSAIAGVSANRISSDNSFLTGTALANGGRALAAGVANAGSMFGIAFQGNNFSALMSFLDSQGVVHTLSSPRVATLNNQKAVLKVGTDALFVTKISSGSASTGSTTTITGGQTNAPTFDTQSFFSGIALDVTPRINDDGTVTLHIRPAVSSVSQNLSTFNLGTLGTFVIPLVSNDISEADTVIRTNDGQVVALGGLMRHAQKETREQVPVLGDAPFLGAAFRTTAQTSEKRELVVLLKVTIIKSDANWAQNILESRERIQSMDRGYSWTTKSDVFGVEGETQHSYQTPQQ
jgi:MSHA biogenesis protein MshL